MQKRNGRSFQNLFIEDGMPAQPNNPPPTPIGDLSKGVKSMPETAAKMNRVGQSQSNTLARIVKASDNIQQMTATQPATIEPARFYTRRQIEAMGICSWMTLRRAERAGKLKVYSYGYRLRRYLGADLLRWMEGKSAKSATAK